MGVLLKKESIFIARIRIIMIMLLVFHHMFEVPGSGFYPRESLSLQGLTLADTMNSFIHWLGMSAVPLLSIISGLLFFRDTPPDFKRLLGRRVTTVLLPSLAWTSLWLVFAYVMYSIGQRINMFGGMNYGFTEFDVLTLLNGIIGIDREPFAFQFWFIHDLLLTFICAPAIYWVIKKLGLMALGVIAILWFADMIPFPFFSGNVLFFFCIGSYMAITGYGFDKLLSRMQPWAPLIYTLFLVLLLGRMFRDLSPVLDSHQYLNLFRIVGVLSASLIVYGMATGKANAKEWLLKLSPYSFFIFAVHYPVIDLVKNVFRLIPYQQTQPGLVLTVVLVPLVTIVICMALAIILKKLASPVFVFLSGSKRI
ncbi:MAG TPA: acyltransferase family protein [Gammaproteobacteria bacterium]